VGRLTPYLIISAISSFLRSQKRRAECRLLGAIASVNARQPVAALTFDDGPHPEYTPRVLETLARHQAHATFFMVGEAARKYPELVRAVAEAGHAIGNHTWNHSPIPSLPRREFLAQIRACQRAIAPYGDRLLRPPYGLQSLSSCLAARIEGYRLITWSAEIEDWREDDAQRMATRLNDGLEPGAILLLHDAIYPGFDERELLFDRQPMTQALDLFLGQNGGRFQFVTVPEVLKHGRPIRCVWEWEG